MIVGHLKKSTRDRELPLGFGSGALTQPKDAIANQCHERSVAGKYAQLSIECRHNDGLRLTLVQHLFR